MSIGFNPGYSAIQPQAKVQGRVQPQFSGNHTVNVTDQTFADEVLKADVPVLVDLWAPWCGPCRSIAPALEELAEEYKGKFKIAKVNIDENRGVFASAQAVSKQLGKDLKGIPAFMVFNNGKVVMPPETGARPKAAFKQLIEAVLKAKEDGKI